MRCAALGNPISTPRPLNDIAIEAYKLGQPSFSLLIAKTERKKKAASGVQASTKLFEAITAHGAPLSANIGWFCHLGRVAKSETMLGHSTYCRSFAFVLRHRNDITGRRPEAVS